MGMFQMHSPGMAGMPPGPDEVPMFVEEPLAPSEEQPAEEVRRSQAWFCLSRPSPSAC